MELVFTSQVSNSSPQYEPRNSTNNSKGLLNSHYQNVVNSIIGKNTSASIFGIRQQMKVKRFYMVSNVETLLKLSIFTILILAMFS